MATPESIAIRRASALERATAAADAIATSTGAAFAPFPAPNRDHEMRPAIEAEWLADTLEVIATSVKDRETFTATIGECPDDADPGVQVDAQGAELPDGDVAADTPEPPQGDDSAVDEQGDTEPAATPTEPQDAPKAAKKSGQR